MISHSYHTSELSKLSFLVTGGAGFIGSNIVEYLLQNNAKHVRVLDNLNTGFRKNIEAFDNHPHFEFMEGDIRNIETCREALLGIDFVSHQAALGSVPRSIKDPLATHQTNVDGFINMLVAAKDAKVKRFVYASSSSVYGDSAELPKREENIGTALSPYAVSKRTNELYAQVFASTYSMEIIGLRYFNVFGPNQSPNGPYAAAIPLFMEALLKNKAPFINGDGEQTRDFTYVANAVQANIKALFAPNDALGKVYNVAVSESISLNNLFNTLKEITGSSIVANHREDRPGDIRNSLADITLARTLLGYEPMVKLKEGLADTIEWFKHNQ